MNQFGRDTLRAAALAGVRQIFGAMRDKYGGRCGLAVLHDALPATFDNIYSDKDALRAYGLDGIADCPVCGHASHEYALVAHGNDVHRLDFFKLAEFMPITDGEEAGR